MGIITKRKALVAWILIAPVVLLRIFTALYPMTATFYYSLFDYNQIERTMDFIGLGNFAAILSDNTILETLKFTGFFTAISIALHLVLGMALAMLLNVQFAGRKFLRTIVLVPWAIPLVVAGIAAKWMFNGEYGLINDILSRIIHIKPDWLISIWGARFSVIATDVWKDTPFMAIMLLAGIQSISTEVYDSARVDGAGPWKRLFNITVPMLTPVIITLLIFFSIWRLTSFDLVFAMTQGGPGSATSLLSYRVYVEAFLNLSFGYSSAIAVFMFVIMCIVGVVGLAIHKKVNY